MKTEISHFLLSVETATPVCSVALACPGGEVLERRETGRSVHSEKTFLFISELLDEAGIGAHQIGTVLLSTGPGSYTGLRIGFSAVLGLTFGSDIPVHRIHTLASIRFMALEWFPGSAVHAVIDARRTHVYHLGPEALPEAASVEEIESVAQRLEHGQVLAGTGIERFPDGAVQGLRLIGTDAVSARGGIMMYTAGLTHPMDIRGEEPDYHQENHRNP